MTRHRLHIVDERPTRDAKEESAKAGKHVGDDLRAYIASRDWARVMIDGDKGPRVDLADLRKRGWRG